MTYTILGVPFKDSLKGSVKDFCRLLWYRGLLFFTTLCVGLLDFKVSYYSSPAETPWLECPTPQTTVRLPGVPNPNRLP